MCRVPTLLIVVLGPDDVETKVRLFEIGADAYLVEPLAPAELLATIAALIRTRKRVSSKSKRPHR
jgi:DNA-binding response OmpR family regulator